MQTAPTLKDRYDLPLSTSSPTAAAFYIEGLDLLISYNHGAEELLQQALDADEGFALAHAALATMHMFRNRVPQAKASISRARELSRGATRREQGHVNAVEAFINGPGPRALDLIQEHVKDFPRDMLLIRITNRLYVLGCFGAAVPNFPEASLAWMRGLAPSYGDDWAFLGQYAFSFHESGYLHEAFRLAQRSLKLYPRNSMASHSVSHVFFERGDASGGLDFLNGWMRAYDPRAPFHVHLSWHQALFELSTGNPQHAHDLYQTAIRPSVQDKDIVALADAASLMWRVQLYAGDDTPFPWTEVRDQALPAAGQPGPAFRDAHAAFAFAASGDEDALNRLVDGVKKQADQGSAVSREVTLPLVKGIGAFAQGRYGEAVDLLEPTYLQLPRIGGSHAQREVFEDTLLEAYLRAEQFEKAEDMLRQRLGNRPSARDEQWLARTGGGNGAPR